MSDRTADQTADTHEPRRLFDLVFPLAFGAVAALATIVWLGAIGVDCLAPSSLPGRLHS
jgi:hypothetical protein